MADTPENDLFYQAETTALFGDNDGAIAVYTTLIESEDVSPESKVSARMKRGRLFQSQGKTQEAFDDFQEAFDGFTITIKMLGVSAQAQALALLDRAEIFKQRDDRSAALADYATVMQMEEAPIELRRSAGRCSWAVHFQLEDWAAVIEDCNFFLILPDSSPAQQISALQSRRSIYEKIGNHAAAIQDCETILSITEASQDQRYEAFVSKADALEKLGRFDEAVAVYDEALNTLELSLERHLRLLLWQCWCYKKIENHAAVVAISDEIILIVEDDKEQRCDAFVDKALALQKLEHFAEAIAVYTKALDTLELSPEKSISLLWSRSLCHEQLNDYALAIKDCDSILATPELSSQQCVSILKNRAIFKGRQGDVDGQIADYSAIIEMPNASDEQKEAARGNKADSLINRGNTRGQQGDVDGQIADYSAVIEMEEAPVYQRAKALYYRGVTLSGRGEKDEALRDYTSVIELENAPVEFLSQALVNRGYIHKHEGEIDAAIAHYSLVIEMDDAPPYPRSVALVNRGYLRRHKHQIQLAMLDYTTVIGMSEAPSEQRAWALINRGHCFDEQGELEKALIDFLSVVEIEDAPVFDRASASNYSATIFSGKGDIRQAIECYSTLIQMKGAPVDQKAEALTSRGILYFFKGQSEDAQQDWLSALTLADVVAETKEYALAQLRYYGLAPRILPALQNELAQKLKNSEPAQKADFAIPLAFLEAHSWDLENPQRPLQEALGKLNGVINSKAASPRQKVWALDHRAYLMARLDASEMTEDCKWILQNSARTEGQRKQVESRLYNKNLYGSLLKEATDVLGIAPGDLTTAVNRTGPVYNSVTEDGIAMPGSHLRPLPLTKTAWSDLQGAAVVNGRIEVFGSKASSTADAFLFTEDTDVVLALIFGGDTATRPATFSLETPEKLVGSSANKDLLLYCEFTPEWMSATAFGKTLSYCDYMLKLAWGCQVPSFFDSTIFTSRMCLRPELRLPDWMADLCFVDNDPGIGVSKGRLCWKIRDVKIERRPIVQKVSFFQKQQHDAFHMTGSQVYVESSLWLTNPDDSDLNRNFMPDDERTRPGKRAAALTRRFDDLCTLFPVFRRLEQLLRLYALVESMRNQGVTLSAQEMARLQGVRRMYTPRPMKELFVPRPPAGGSLGAYGGVQCGCPDTTVNVVPTPVSMPSSVQFSAPTPVVQPLTPVQNNNSTNVSSYSSQLAMSDHYSNGKMGTVQQQTVAVPNGPTYSYQVETFRAPDGQRVERPVSVEMEIRPPDTTQRGSSIGTAAATNVPYPQLQQSLASTLPANETAHLKVTPLYEGATRREKELLVQVTRNNGEVNEYTVAKAEPLWSQSFTQNGVLVNMPAPYRNVDNATVITNRLDAPQKRQNFEEKFFPGVAFGLENYDRAHSQGASLGNESPEGILLAPAKVNRVFQNHGIESYLRDLYSAKREDVEFILTTVTSAHEGTSRLKSIEYRVDVVENGKRSKFFEASIEVGRNKDNPTIHCPTPEFYGDRDRYIKRSPKAAS